MKKVKNSFGGIIGGLILLVVGTVLLWWNEGNNVKNIKTVAEAEKIVIDVSSEKVDNANEGKLIATNGDMVVEGNVEDTTFGVSVNSAKLSRLVEYYEWEESCTTDDEGYESCTYSKGWYDHIIDSSSFKEKSHTNPTSVIYPSEDFTNSNVSVGAFIISKDEIKMMDTDTTYTLTAENEVTGFHLDGSYLTNSKDLSNAQVGDTRISFKYNDWKEVSVLAVQKGNTFEDFISDAGKTINRVEEGKVSGSVMLEHIANENNTMKWIFRGVGALLVILGYLALVNPISTIASFVPILGDLVGGALSIVAFIIGLVHSLIVIAIAWFRFRPLLSIILIVLAVILVIVLRKYTKGKGTKENKSK